MWLESGSSGECADNTLGAGLRQLCDTWEYYAIHGSCYKDEMGKRLNVIK